MTIRPQTMGEVAVLEMGGTMAGPDFKTLHRHLVSLLRGRRRRILLDFRRVDHVSYRDATLLAREFDLVHSYNGDLKVAGLSPYVRDILVFAGLGGFLERHTSEPKDERGLVPSHEPHAS
jgi:anti-anti-sigma regulatory factor